MLTWLNEGGGPVEFMLLVAIYGFILTIWTGIADVLALLVTETVLRRQDIAVRASWAGAIVGALIAVIVILPPEPGSMVDQWPWSWRIAIGLVMAGVWFAIAFWLRSRKGGVS